MSSLLISRSSYSFLGTLQFVQCSSLLKSWVLLVSAMNCCKIIAPRLPWVCTNLTGLVEAIAASDNEDSLEWRNCQQYGGESTSQREVKIAYLLSESRAQKWQKSVAENVFRILVERWEGTVIPEFISATLAACVHLNMHLQYEDKLKSPWCPQQRLFLCVG